MRAIRYVVVAAALIGPLALGPGAAAKKPSRPLTLEVDGQPLSPGAPLEASSSTFELENNAFSVHCTESSLVGALKTNERSKAVAATIHTATFRGGATIDPEACESGREWVLTWDPSRLEFFIRGEAKISGAKLKMIPRENVGTRHEPGCHLAAKSLKASFNIGETLQPLVLQFATRFKMEFQQGAICTGGNPEHEPYMYGEFTFTSEGHAVEVVA